MVKPSSPRMILAKLVTRQGSGKVRDLRKGVTAQEIADALAVVLIAMPRADLRAPLMAHRICLWVLKRTLAPDRVPRPTRNWDLVAVYARLRGISRDQACAELKLPVWKPPVKKPGMKPRPKPA